jgi:hypothetical protein
MKKSQPRFERNTIVAIYFPATASKELPSETIPVFREFKAQQQCTYVSYIVYSMTKSE